MAKTVADLMNVTGWAKCTVLAALREGRLPGYQSSGKGGRWTVPDDAFRKLEAGTWRPAGRQTIIVRPARKSHDSTP